MNELALAKAEFSGNLKIETMDDLGRLAKMLAQSGYFADAKDAAQCGVKVLAGLELGFPAFASMTGIHIIKGKPTMGANLMAAAIKRSGRYNYKVLELTDSVCRLELFEQGASAGVSEFTIDDARKAGTQNLEKFPKNMLFARAISNAIKWFCPDLFLGAAVYTPDELGEATPDAAVISPFQGESSAELLAEVTPYITEAQRRRLHAIRANNGVSEKDLKICIAQVQNCAVEEASTKTLTQSQYEEVCAMLEDLGAAQVEA